ncbi:oligosaccharide flippase family protein [Pseudoalteromonas sp. S4741]|uniref:oligosaccharide flippase family protein n=1 Tax=Pseudoalteromonas sp. S4741 TaxID=579563 RepID=UPI00110B41AE|nr:oligosaccharide flippase family protein [Pseudoalteromonas sp. S4741]TMO22081.1 hypothetical protein CWC30_12355 [Pseudoalteromonas sp. S4741]
MKSKLLSNFLNLSFIQLLALFFPFFTYPFIIEKIGSVLFGTVIIAQVVVSYLQVIVIFGTDITLVRKAASEGENEIKNFFIAAVMFRFVLCIISLVILLVLLITLQLDAYLYLITSFILLEALFSLRWYYHGKQIIHIYTLFHFLSKVSSFILIFLLINEDSTVYELALINFFIPFLFSFLLFVFTFFKIKVSFRTFKISEALLIFNESKSVFFSNILSMAKDKTSILIVGYVINPSLVVYFDLAVKLSNVISSIFSSFSSAIYPILSSNFDLNYYRKNSTYVFTGAIFIALLVILIPYKLSGLLQLIMSVDISPMSAYSYLFGIMIFVRSHSYYQGLCYLMAQKKSRLYTSTLISSSFLYLITIPVIFLFKEPSFQHIAIHSSCILAFEYLHRFLIIRNIDKNESFSVL